MILPPLGKLYGLMMKARNALYDLGILRSSSLGARTVSVGNLTTGGTGKTPLVALISEILLDTGETVCVLTRGYGRANPRERVLVSDGSSVLANAATGGDEPVELATRLGGRAIIVADPDRLAAGRWAKEKFGVTAFVLDDGFQHRRVKRDLDIVCIDATDPWGNGRILPAGRLRESIEGVNRADAIVLTRVELVEDTSAIEENLRSWNPEAAIFRSSTRVAGLLDLGEFHANEHMVIPESDRTKALSEGVRAAVFCAVGNPDAFAKTIERHLRESGDGSCIVFRKAFADHHSYKQTDIDAVEREAKANGADSLITTAKDAVKLKGLRFTLPCRVAVAETAVDDADAFRRLVIPV